MNRRQKLRRSAELVADPAKSYPPLTLGKFTVPQFNGLSMAFGAHLNQYPPMDTIPAEFQPHSGKFQDVVSALFFRGGSLADHDLKLRVGLDHAAAMAAIRAWMSSFDPKHEHKTATVAWALSEWTQAL